MNIINQCLHKLNLLIMILSESVRLYVTDTTDPASHKDLRGFCISTLDKT